MLIVFTDTFLHVIIKFHYVAVFPMESTMLIATTVGSGRKVSQPKTPDTMKPSPLVQAAAIAMSGLSQSRTVRIGSGDETFEVERYESRKKTRKVGCCGKIQCKLPNCWKAINFVNSMAFWMLWGVLFAIGFERGLMLPVWFFAVVVVTWNPLYYSGNLENKYTAMKSNDNLRRCCGICGWTLGCSWIYCRKCSGIDISFGLFDSWVRVKENGDWFNIRTKDNSATNESVLIACLFGVLVVLMEKVKQV